ncbi:ABC transporter permease subunit [Raineyella sp. W15-4]|uniref:ABC transporter permease subunit n=1 Tax=Raineyella sp. W15-4 TaxID=3081651 RepID=UPI00295522EC|nr:hypothetical protein [Raineyella sp. W15-4]WOQ17466.1 hypothetical protein R0145_01735 [Raineyella sp. W15-4]
MSIVLQVLFQGLGIGSVLLLGALGLMIIYGVMGIVNLAHGEFVMVGAYASVVVSTVGMSWLSIPAAVLVAGALGLLVDVVVVRYFYNNPVASMLGTFGIGMVLQSVVLLVFGPNLQRSEQPITASVPIGFGQSFSVWRLVLIGVAVVTTIGLGLVLARTKYGLTVRLVTADRQVASTLGIRSKRTNRWTFALGCALAGFGGALAAPLANVSPTMGVTYLANSFLVVVLARLGDVRSTALWSAALGVGLAGVAAVSNDVVATIIIWVAALAIVAVRRTELSAVRV